MSRNADFEKSISELENIVAQLESGDITLDESIKLFERGMELTNLCRKTLESARQKITALTKEEQENGENQPSILRSARFWIHCFKVLSLEKYTRT